MPKPAVRLDPMPVIANRRIDTLLALAQQEVEVNEARAKHYVRLARAIATRHRIPLGRARKHLFCKTCQLPWTPGKNVRVRLERRSKRAIYTCACGAKKAFPYSEK